MFFCSHTLSYFLQQLVVQDSSLGYIKKHTFFKFVENVKNHVGFFPLHNCTLCCVGLSHKIIIEFIKVCDCKVRKSGKVHEDYFCKIQ